jgi:hypothetical protein
LHDAINTAGEVPPSTNHIPPNTRCVSEDLWRRYCYQGGISGSDDQKAREKAFKRSAETLLADKRIGSWGGWIWPAVPGRAEPGPAPAKGRDRHDVVDRIFMEIDRGLPSSNGDVRHYSLETAWRVVRTHRPELDDDACKDLVKTWSKAGVFVQAGDGVRISLSTKQSRRLE